MVLVGLFLTLLDSLVSPVRADRLSMVVVLKEVPMFMGHIYAKEVFVFYLKFKVN